MKSLFIMTLLLFCVGCASFQRADDVLYGFKPVFTQDSLVKVEPKVTTPSVRFFREVQSDINQEETNIDLDGLQRQLDFYKSPDSLGYSEKTFSTCEVGYGYSRNKECRREILVLINFQLYCRYFDSDSYSKALSQNDMRPIAQRRVNWTLQNWSGQVDLDNQGYGQIRLTAKSSLRLQRLKMIIENENLYIKAGEATKIVTPANWCI